VDEIWDFVGSKVPVTARSLKGDMSPQLKGQLGAKFLFSVDAERFLQQHLDKQIALTQQRVVTLRQFALDGKITPEQFQEGERLLLKTTVLSKRDRQIFDEYLAVIEGRLAPEKLERSLELIPKASASEFENSIGMKLKLIPAGEFLMGSPADEADRSDDEGPQHKVRITKPFYIGVTEVTQGQWFLVMNTKPWTGKEYVKEGEDYPAVYVNWDDAVEYCKKLSTKENESYRLPTEAEWEYACRGGTSTSYSFGSSSDSLRDYAWFTNNANDIGEPYAHPVGTKRPNPFGLHDMHGNVWEWCADLYDSAAYKKRSSGISDPVVDSGSGSFRVSRGGSWLIFDISVRSSRRYRSDPGKRGTINGFRVVAE